MIDISSDKVLGDLNDTAITVTLDVLDCVYFKSEEAYGLKVRSLINKRETHSVVYCSKPFEIGRHVVNLGFELKNNRFKYVIR